MHQKQVFSTSDTLSSIQRKFIIVCSSTRSYFFRLSSEKKSILFFRPLFQAVKDFFHRSCIYISWEMFIELIFFSFFETLIVLFVAGFKLQHNFLFQFLWWVNSTDGKYILRLYEWALLSRLRFIIEKREIFFFSSQVLYSYLRKSEVFDLTPLATGVSEHSHLACLWKSIVADDDYPSFIQCNATWLHSPSPEPQTRSRTSHTQASLGTGGCCFFYDFSFSFCPSQGACLSLGFSRLYDRCFASLVAPRQLFAAT